MWLMDTAENRIWISISRSNMKDEDEEKRQDKLTNELDPFI